MRRGGWVVALIMSLTTLLAESSHAQDKVDVVYLRDGSTIIGTIIETIPENSLTIRTKEGDEWHVPFASVARITRETYGPPNHLDSSYAEIGLTLGTPAMFNVTGGYWFGRFGLRITGLSYEELGKYGVQTNLGLRLFDDGDNSHMLGLIIGTSLLDERRTYWGAAYNFNLHGFFLEAGVGWQGLPYSRIGFMPVFQAGFVWHP